MLIGTLVLPPPHKVAAGYRYGADGTEYTGTLGATAGPTPDIEEAVYRRLAGDEGIRAIVGDRIYPDVGDTDAPRPQLVYFLQSSDKQAGLSETAGLNRHSVGVVSDAIGKADARALALAVKTCLDLQTFDGVQRAYWADESGDETDDGFSILQSYTVIQ